MIQPGHNSIHNSIMKQFPTVDEEEEEDDEAELGQEEEVEEEEDDEEEEWSELGEEEEEESDELYQHFVTSLRGSLTGQTFISPAPIACSIGMGKFRSGRFRSIFVCCRNVLTQFTQLYMTAVSQLWQLLQWYRITCWRALR